MKTNCINCVWADDKARKGKLVCRRFPPTPTPEGDYFPIVNPDGWCGEGKKK